jgi:hypothetical protein
MTTLFISHSSKQKAWAEEIWDALSSHGYQSLFLDSHPEDGIPAGVEWEQDLWQKLRQSRGLVVLCTGDWLRSPWCVAEAMIAAFDGRRVEAAFDGGAVTSDAGALLLREVDRTIGLIDRVRACFWDGRDPGRVAHSLKALISQRIIGLALGYEDVNDHDALRCWRCLRIDWNRGVPTARRSAVRAH